MRVKYFQHFGFSYRRCVVPRWSFPQGQAASGLRHHYRQGDLHRHAAENEAHRYVQGADLRQAARHADQD